MRKFRSRTITAWQILVPSIFFFAGVAHTQEMRPSMHLTTQERIETEAWWPTMTTAPLAAYAGSASCTGCHSEQIFPSTTGMQRAAIRSTDASLLQNLAPKPLSSGVFQYALATDRAAIHLSVSGNGHKALQNADWAFGAGDLARTFLYKADDRWFQSEASYFTHLAGLDITPGFGPSSTTSPKAALGNVLTAAEARTCFNCHTVHATTSAGFEPSLAEPGTGCEACHGPGRQHVNEMTTAGSAGVTLSSKYRATAIFSPGGLLPSDSIDYCGACHRSFADASLSTGPSADRAVVRFQPYRLEESKCWRATQDERLTCVACHNPHKPLNRDAAGYDKNCLQCHSRSLNENDQTHTASVCPKATHDCVTCHMPKVNVPSMHGNFTDHYIRISRAGDPLPR